MKMQGLTVQLSHASNPDIMGGYWQEPMDSGKAQAAFGRAQGGFPMTALLCLPLAKVSV